MPEHQQFTDERTGAGTFLTFDNNTISKKLWIILFYDKIDGDEIRIPGTMPEFIVEQMFHMFRYVGLVKNLEVSSNKTNCFNRIASIHRNTRIKFLAMIDF